MAFGPGKYDDICGELVYRLDADGVLLIVLNGKRGNGASCKLAVDQLHRQELSTSLRKIADAIEKDYGAFQS